MVCETKFVSKMYQIFLKYWMHPFHHSHQTMHILDIWHAITYILQWARSRHKHLLTSDSISSVQVVNSNALKTKQVCKISRKAPAGIPAVSLPGWPALHFCAHSSLAVRGRHQKDVFSEKAFFKPEGSHEIPHHWSGAVLRRLASLCHAPVSKDLIEGHENNFLTLSTIIEISLLKWSW